jgi:hypothetical protein
MALVNLKAAINKVGLAQLERGNTTAKKALLAQAQTSVGLALSSDTSCTGTRATLTRAFQDALQFALDAENNAFNGSGGLVTAVRQRTGVDYLELGVRETAGNLLTNLAATFLAIIKAAPAFTFTPASLPGGTHAVPYSQQLSVTGGDGGETFALTSGSFPASITMTTGGLISGTTAFIGTQSNMVITVTDVNGNTGTKTYSVVFA